MLAEQIGMGIIGLSSGFLISGALVSFVISLRILPRFSGITHTADHIGLYENMVFWGTVLGNVVDIYRITLWYGTAGLAVVGLFWGIYLGCWAIALAEVINIFPVTFRRLGITKGVGWIVISIAVGKLLGSMIYFVKGW